ncbi:MAG: hypothetical protein RLZZ347_391 [Candidatus Parcubacteria bacterium]|jgi:hypothetical protein
MKKAVSTDQKRNALIDQVVSFCNWAESDSGQEYLLRKDEDGVQGHRARTELNLLRQDITALLDGWPDEVFVVDLRHHQWAFDSYCEISPVLMQIERERGLPEKSLQARFTFVDSSDPDAPAYRALVEKEQQTLEKAVLTREPAPVNPLASALATVGL